MEYPNAGRVNTENYINFECEYHTCSFKFLANIILQNPYKKLALIGFAFSGTLRNFEVTVRMGPGFFLSSTSGALGFSPSLRNL